MPAKLAPAQQCAPPTRSQAPVSEKRHRAAWSASSRHSATRCAFPSDRAAARPRCSGRRRRRRAGPRRAVGARVSRSLPPPPSQGHSREWTASFARPSASSSRYPDAPTNSGRRTTLIHQRQLLSRRRDGRARARRRGPSVVSGERQPGRPRCSSLDETLKRRPYSVSRIARSPRHAPRATRERHRDSFRQHLDELAVDGVSEA